MGGQLIALAARQWMPEPATQVAKDVDALFYLITGVSVFFFVLVVGLCVFFVVRYRRRHEGQRTAAIRGSFPIEVAWAVVPALFLLLFFVLGFRGFMDQSVPPRNALDIRATGQKWFWSFDYPKLGINSTELAVPVGRAVRLTMSSQDVIHSFYVPAFRIKRDVLPNRYTVLWFEPTQVGTYDVFCAEYCGTSHSKMLTQIKVMSESDYQKWVDSGGGLSGEGMSSVEFGQVLYKQKGCATCHSTDGTQKTGPSLAGKFGKQEHMTSGAVVQVDDNYLRDSIMDPASQVVQGYTAVMPTFKGKLTDAQLNALIDYIKSLSP